MPAAYSVDLSQLLDPNGGLRPKAPDRWGIILDPASRGLSVGAAGLSLSTSGLVSSNSGLTSLPDGSLALKIDPSSSGAVVTTGTDGLKIVVPASTPTMTWTEGTRTLSLAIGSGTPVTAVIPDKDKQQLVLDPATSTLTITQSDSITGVYTP
jgi:hypothetical protein